MRVTALGHAGLRIETAAATLLVDPWLSPEGAFQASWFQYPDNAHLVTPALFVPTAVALSHEHCDHLDPWLLSRLPSRVPVIIPRYPSPVLRRKIVAAGPRRVIELAPWEPYEVAAGTRIFFVSEASPMNHDSAVVVQGDGQTVLDLNDARLFPVQLRAIRQAVGGHVDVFAVQGAGASWYPMNYGYTPERAAELSRQKRSAKLAYVERAIRVLEPGVTLPFAGPPCFLASDLFRHNREMEQGIFPDQQQVSDHLRTSGLAATALLLPGDAWDVDLRAKRADPVWHGFYFADRWSYLAAYAARRHGQLAAVLARHPEPATSLWEPFRDYFERLVAMSPYFNRRIDQRVGFEVTGPGGGRWAVDFRPGSEGVSNAMGEGCGHVYRFAARWLPSILGGTTPWEDFFLSLRFEVRRDPDLYNDHLLGLLKFAEREPLAPVEAYETSLASDERITVHAEGRTYRVSRHCPHAGNDLLVTGEVLAGGVLRCLAHHYEFELATGRCINGACPSLEVEEIGGPAPGASIRRSA